jgi:hypothetical protein
MVRNRCYGNPKLRHDSDESHANKTSLVNAEGYTLQMHADVPFRINLDRSCAHLNTTTVKTANHSGRAV